MTEPTGYTALDLIGFTDQGEYDSSTAYVKNDLVHYNNSIWRCLVDDTTAQTPTEGTYWTIFVEDSTSASGISYDGTDSGLSATTVQDAIDEVVDEKADSTIISDAYNSSTTYAAGDYFIYDNTLYHVDVACTGITPPNANYYTSTSVSSEISNINMTEFTQKAITVFDSLTVSAGATVKSSTPIGSTVNTIMYGGYLCTNPNLKVDAIYIHPNKNAVVYWVTNTSSSAVTGNLEFYYFSAD